MKLESYLQNWHHLLADGLVSDELGSHKIQKMYYGFVQSHYIGALEKMLSHTKLMLASRWDKLVKNYYKKYPPMSYELNALTYQFDEFLINEGIEKYICELATYEIVEFQVFMDKAMISGGLNPTTQFLECEYEIAKWVKDDCKGLPEAVRNILAISRDPKSQLCIFTQLDAPAILWLNKIEDDQSTQDVPLDVLSFFKQQALYIDGV